MTNSKRLKIIRNLLKRLIVVFIFLFGWEAFARLEVVNSRVLSSPFEIFDGIFQLVRSGNLLIDIIHSVKRVLIGFTLGSMVGIIAAIFLGLNKPAKEYLGFMIEILRPIPPIAWIPISILWFGIGDTPAYYLVGLGTFFPVFTNTLKAINGIESKYINLAFSLGATKFIVFRKVLIPMIFPDVFTGFRIGLGVGWIVVITAEMVGTQSGLGYMIQLNRIMLQMPNVIVGMIAIGIIGLLLSFTMNFIEDLIIPWQKRMATIEREK